MRRAELQLSLRTTILATLAALPVLAGLGLPAAATPGRGPDEPVFRAPVDWGYGPGVRPGSWRQKLQSAAEAALPRRAAAEVAGGRSAHLGGAFGPVMPYPIIPLHAVLLSDGRVFSFGTNERGQQTGQFVYDLWDPRRGTGAGSHTILPVTTGTDLFCAGQTVLAGSSEVLLAGGDLTIRGRRNFATEDVNIFDPRRNSLRSAPKMRWKRWYPTLVTLANGSVLTMGGYERPGRAVITPELYRPGSGWQTLSGATSDPAFGYTGLNWHYPRAYLRAAGDVVVIGNREGIFLLNPAGNGTITRTAGSLPNGNRGLPTVMYAPGRVLSVRGGRAVSLIDLNGATPRVTRTGSVSAHRLWSNATVLPSGEVVVTGGSGTDVAIYQDVLRDVTYHAEIWSPTTGSWTRGASAAKPRLYHSVALLLPDATLLTAGGGAPGPVTNLNAEIYYPPYLYKRDGSGQLAPRPTIVAAPTALPRNGSFQVQVGNGQRIATVTLIRTGAPTHSFDADQRRLPLAFRQDGVRLTVTAAGGATMAPPGYYLLFVLDQQGVPSIGRIVSLGV